jgi:hypothetical protein
MALVSPIQLFPGYVSDGTVITIPLADLPGLTAAEANAATGNAMEVLRIIVERFQMALVTLAPTARPTRATLEKAAPTIAFGTGIAPGTLRQVYTMSFDLTPTGLQPTPE